MQGLISKFSFSVGTYSKSFKKIESSGYGEEKYGFLYIQDIDNIFSLENGLNEKKLDAPFII